MKNFKSEKGSISVYVFTTFFLLTIILISLYTKYTTKESAGIKETLIIKNTYENSYYRQNYIYNELYNEIL